MDAEKNTTKVSNPTAILIPLFIFLAIFAYMDSKGDGDKKHTTKWGYVATSAKWNLDKAINLQEVDYAAFLQMEQSGLATQTVAGDRVFIEKRAWGKIKIRKEGSDTSMWTVRGAVE